MNDYELRYELLALTLGIKNNDCIFAMSEDEKKGYHLLFSTYQIMIEQDKDEFFIQTKKKDKVLTSLKNTLDFYEATNEREIKKILEKLENNNPESFFILPIGCLFNELNGHVFGIIIYKKDKEYIVTMVDKNLIRPVEYVTIAKDALDKFISYLFLNDKKPLEKKLYFNEAAELVSLSKEKMAIPLNIKTTRQFVGNCLVSEIEATLKLALFNCEADLFNRPPFRYTKHLKWGATFPVSTLEMRKRFLTAIKTNYPIFDEKLDDLFDKYLARKNDAKNFRRPPQTKLDFLSIQEKFKETTSSSKIKNDSFLHSHYSVDNER